MKDSINGLEPKIQGVSGVFTDFHFQMGQNLRFTMLLNLKMPKLTEKELKTFFEHEFPQMDFIMEKCDGEYITVKKEIHQKNLRPGGTVSGPTMMAVADFAIYAAILREIGLIKLAVTTSFNINFLKKPIANKDILARCKLLKCGKTLAIGEVSIYSEGIDEPVAHAVGTYSIPPAKDS